MHLAALGLSHHNAPIGVREQLALPPERLDAAFAWARACPGLGGLVILSTCNRTEFYAALPDGRELLPLVASLFETIGVPKSAAHPLIPRRGTAVAHHLFRVAAGLDSMVVGETEIFGQVKHAYALASRHACAGPLLHRLFQHAFRAGKQVRSQTDITRGAVSVASVAVELAERIFGALHRARVILLGAGDTSEKVARHLLARGATSILVANRTHQRALDLAANLGGQALPFDQWRAEFPHAQIIISSTSAAQTLLTAAEFAPLLPRRPSRPLFLIDLAVPRDIDPALAEADDVYLYNIDDLTRIAERHLEERRAAVAEGEAIVERHARDFAAWLDRRLRARPVPPSAANLSEA